MSQFMAERRWLFGQSRVGLACMRNGYPDCGDGYPAGISIGAISPTGNYTVVGRKMTF